MSRIASIDTLRMQGATLDERIGKQRCTQRPRTDARKHRPGTAQAVTPQQGAGIDNRPIVSDEQHLAHASQLTATQPEQNGFVMVRTREAL